MAAIIRVRDENGNVIDIPAIVGAPGEKGETGAQGEKGDKGDPGAVQTVNGVAPDENGNVEVAAGGGEDVWEDIINTTLEENVASMHFTKDINGNAFSLKEFTVFVVHQPVIDDTANHRCVLTINGGSWGSQSAIEIRSSPKGTEQTTYSFVHITTVDGCMRKELVKVSANADSIRAVLVDSVAPNSYTGALVLAVDTTTNKIKTAAMPCTKISFIGLDSVILGAGSQIIVRGVRV